MDPAELVDRLWRDGAGVDDREAIAAARASGGPPVLELFAEWLATGDGDIDAGVDPSAAVDEPSRLLARAIELRAACNRREPAEIDTALLALDATLPKVLATTGAGVTAHAAADLALAEAALVGRDAESARHCLERIGNQGPAAFRIEALHRQASLFMASGDLPRASTRARQALTFARTVGREAQAVQSQILLGLVAYMQGDADGMRSTLNPLIGGEDGGMARVLLAGFESPEKALPILAEGMKTAAQTGDALGYVICALVGARRYLAIDRRADALVTLSAARVQLERISLGMVGAIDAELESWRKAWGDDEFAAAEREAVASFDRPSER